MKKYSIILVLCIIISGCVTTTLSPMTASDFSFEDDEMRLWVRSEEEEKIINESGLVYKDEELENYLNQVANKLEPNDIFKNFLLGSWLSKIQLLTPLLFPTVSFTFILDYFLEWIMKLNWQLLLATK